MICQARPKINIEEATGKYEFSMVLRAFFAADGTMLHCSTKSALITLIDREISSITPSDAPTAAPLMRNKVVIVDGKAELQSLRKPATITTCARLADHFTNQLFQRYSESDELHLVFDKYDVALSLKSATRERR